MIINFAKIEEITYTALKGGEGTVRSRTFADDNNRIILGRLAPGSSIGLHRHEDSSEMIAIVKGRGKVLFAGEYEPVKEGDVHYCPQGFEHSLINDGADELVYFAMVPRHC